MNLHFKIVFLYFLSFSKCEEMYETYFEGFPKISKGPKSWTSRREYPGIYKLKCIIDLLENAPECRLFADIRLESSVYSACLFKTSKGRPKELFIYEKPTKLFEEIPNSEEKERFLICKVLSIQPKKSKNDFKTANFVPELNKNINLTENFEYGGSIKKMNLNFTTMIGSNIEFYCVASLIEEKEDCRWHEVTFYDGETLKLCSGWERIFKTSKNNVLRVKMSFRIPVAVKCFARATKDSNKEEIKLGIRQSPYRIENKENGKFIEGTYRFSNDRNARISAQCQMLQEELPCAQNYIEIDDGYRSEIFCGEQKLVFITKNKNLTIRVRLGKKEKKFLCTVQAVTGPLANQWDNLVSTKFPLDIASGAQVGTNCDCGRRDVTEVRMMDNGRIAKDGEYTWMVSVQDYSGKHLCGGSLITPRHIITAAHCVLYVYSLTFRNIMIVIGSHRLHDKSSIQMIVPKQNIFPHEKFKMTSLEYDIAILFLENPVKFGPKIGPICLPKKYPDMIYREVIMTGWGLTSNHLSDVLRVSQMFNIPSKVCQLEKMICMYKNDSGSCVGDSGGPFVLYDTEINRFVQVAVVSYGITEECLPGMTAGTNLTFMYYWIQRIIKRTDKNTRICTKIET